MPSKLNIFPARVPIGSVTDQAGRTYDVLMTPEFARALGDLMTRVGGTVSLTADEIAALVAIDTTDGAALAVLQRMVVDLAAQLQTQASMAARVGALERRLEDLARLAHGIGPAPVDWEHPGKIGAGKANSGAFTMLTSSGKTQLNPANADVEAKPTGTGTVTIQPALAAGGQIDNMELGKTTPKPARVTTLNKLTFTQPANGATWTLTDGKTFSVANTLNLTSTDGATLNIGGGGTLGTAAYTAASNYATRTGSALGGPATDPASTMALANALRTACLLCGIGS